MRITVDHGVRIDAVGARVPVTLRAQSSLAATAAAKKVAEVRALVEALATVGVGEDAIDVTGLYVVTGSGKIITSQEVTITLEIAATPDQLPAVLGILTVRQGLTVDDVEWMFDEFEASIPATAEAMRMARRKADALADAAGVTITGITTMSDSWSVPGPRMELALMGSQATMRSAAPMDMGMTISSSTELSVHLTVDFDVSASS
ncbi:MAG: SIMPL domain-containing protein [Propionibacteriaceae bacterium]